MLGGGAAVTLADNVDKRIGQQQEVHHFHIFFEEDDCVYPNGFIAPSQDA